MDFFSGQQKPIANQIMQQHFMNGTLSSTNKEGILVQPNNYF